MGYLIFYSASLSSRSCHRRKTWWPDDLAWACFSCNLHKGPNIAGLDPDTEELTRLFHPRTDMWTEHFVWDGAWLRGRTAVGRTTLAVLAMNATDSVVVRDALRDEGTFNA